MGPAWERIIHHNGKIKIKRKREKKRVKSKTYYWLRHKAPIPLRHFDLGLFKIKSLFHPTSKLTAFLTRNISFSLFITYQREVLSPLSLLSLSLRRRLEMSPGKRSGESWGAMQVKEEAKRKQEREERKKEEKRREKMDKANNRLQVKILEAKKMKEMWTHKSTEGSRTHTMWNTRWKREKEKKYKKETGERKEKTNHPQRKKERRRRRKEKYWITVTVYW